MIFFYLDIVLGNKKCDSIYFTKLLLRWRHLCWSRGYKHGRNIILRVSSFNTKWLRLVIRFIDNIIVFRYKQKILVHKFKQIICFLEQRRECFLYRKNSQINSQNVYSKPKKFIVFLKKCQNEDKQEVVLEVNPKGPTNAFDKYSEILLKIDFISFRYELERLMELNIFLRRLWISLQKYCIHLYFTVVNYSLPNSTIEKTMKIWQRVYFI